MKKCDVVMKGGITSGIVYPGAVCELAQEYEFASIGGTSAGAIAAALTAAAEYRRQNGSSAGFEDVARLPEWLAGTSGNRSRLLQLFRPSESTAPMFDVAITYIETPGSTFAKARATLGALLRHFNRYGSMILAIGAVFALIATVCAFLLWDRSALVALGAILTVVAIAIATPPDSSSPPRSRRSSRFSASCRKTASGSAAA